jgi:hypothetical protein
MATGVQYKRWTAAAFAPISLFGIGISIGGGVGACGEGSGNSRDAAVEPEADVGGIERLLAQLDDGVAGLPCTTDVECAGTNARCSPGTEGAVRSCTGLCDDDDQCGADGTCVEVARLGTQTVSFCQKECTEDSDCDARLQCSQSFNAYEVIVSISNALSGADVFAPSGTPTICQERIDTVQMDDDAVGAACEPDSDCGGGTCNTFAAAFPNGYCSGKCLKHEQCGMTGACVRDIASETLGLPGACLRKCTDSSECRQDEGYGCWPLPSFIAQDASSYCMNEQPWREGMAGFPFPGSGDATADAGAP